MAEAYLAVKFEQTTGRDVAYATNAVFREVAGKGQVGLVYGQGGGGITWYPVHEVCSVWPFIVPEGATAPA